MKENPIKSVIKRIIPRRLRKGLRNNLVTASTNKVTPMKDQTRIMLNDFFREDVKKLSALLNRDLTNWTK